MHFNILWTAITVSSLGDGVTSVAAALLVASLTGNPLAVSGVFFAATLPWLVFSLVSGGLVDRLDRRRVIVTVDCIRAVAIGTLGVTTMLDWQNLPLLYAVMFLLGTGETLVRAANQAILPSVVKPDLLLRANGRIGASLNVVHDMIAGPLAGLLFALAAAVPFLLDGGTFALAAILLAILPGNFRPKPTAEGPEARRDRPPLRTEIAAGVRWLLAHRLLRTLAVLIGLLNATLTAAMAILVLLASQRLGLGSLGYGLLFTSLAVGGLLGALAGEHLIRRFTASVTLRVGLLVEAAFHLTLALSTNVVVVGIALAVFGIHGSLWGIVTVSLRQRLTPPEMLGRVSSAYLFVSAGGNAFGALLGGVVATRFGLTAPYWIGFVVAAVVAVTTWHHFDRKTMAALGAPPA